MMNEDNMNNPPSIEASSSSSPNTSHPFSSQNKINDEEIDTSSFEDLSMNAAMGLDSSEYILIYRNKH
jgi:hypothetical protein